MSGGASKPKPNAATKGSIPAAPTYRIPADFKALNKGGGPPLIAFPRAGCTPDRMHAGRKAA